MRRKRVDLRAAVSRRSAQTQGSPRRRPPDERQARPLDQLEPCSAKWLFFELDDQLSILKNISELIELPHHMRDFFDEDPEELVQYAPPDAHFDAGHAVGFARGLAAGLQCSLDELFLKASRTERPTLEEILGPELSKISGDEDAPSLDRELRGDLGET